MIWPFNLLFKEPKPPVMLSAFVLDERVMKHVSGKLLAAGIPHEIQANHLFLREGHGFSVWHSIVTCPEATTDQVAQALTALGVPFTRTVTVSVSDADARLFEE